MASRTSRIRTGSNDGDQTLKSEDTNKCLPSLSLFVFVCSSEDESWPLVTVIASHRYRQNRFTTIFVMIFININITILVVVAIIVTRFTASNCQQIIISI